MRANNSMRVSCLVLAITGLLAACGKPQAVKISVDPSHLGIAQAAEESGDYSMAESILARASSAAPSDPMIQLRYADVLLKQRKLSQARDVLERHLKTVTDPQMLHGALGAIYVVQGDPGQAIIEFDAAKPDDPRWLLDRAVALDTLHRHDDAQVLYRRLLASDANDVAVITDFALSLMLAGRPTEAMQVAAPLVGRTDLPPRARASLGAVMAASGDLKGAQGTVGTTVSEQQLIRIAEAVNKRN